MIQSDELIFFRGIVLPFYQPEKKKAKDLIETLHFGLHGILRGFAELSNLEAEELEIWLIVRRWQTSYDLDFLQKSQLLHSSQPTDVSEQWWLKCLKHHMFHHIFLWKSIMITGHKTHGRPAICFVSRYLVWFGRHRWSNVAHGLWVSGPLWIEMKRLTSMWIPPKKRVTNILIIY